MVKRDKDIKEKKAYKGPFQNNPNIRFQTTKSNMHPKSDGPTVDIFSNKNSTTNIYDELDSNVVKSENKRPRKKRNKAKDFFNENIKEIIIGAIVSTMCLAIGIIVYNHSNHFISVDKDVEYLKEAKNSQESELKELNKTTNNIDKKVDLLEQKVDYKINDKNK